MPEAPTLDMIGLGAEAASRVSGKSAGMFPVRYKKIEENPTEAVMNSCSTRICGDPTN